MCTWNLKTEKLKMVCNDDYYYFLILELKFVNFDCIYNITLCVKYMIDLFSLIKKACISCINCFLFIFLNYLSHIKLYRSGKIMHSQGLQIYGQDQSDRLLRSLQFSLIMIILNSIFHRNIYILAMSSASRQQTGKPW